KDISKILNLTESRISQIHSKAIKKIREMMGEYF
ncbi:MAG: sigma factor-like helix-turn-helix DNA-binding protein, partial [Caldanaerobacter sp.]